MYQSVVGGVVDAGGLLVLLFGGVCLLVGGLFGLIGVLSVMLAVFVSRLVARMWRWVVARFLAWVGV